MNEDRTFEPNGRDNDESPPEFPKGEDRDGTEPFRQGGSEYRDDLVPALRDEGSDTSGTEPVPGTDPDNDGPVGSEDPGDEAEEELGDDDEVDEDPGDEAEEELGDDDEESPVMPPTHLDVSPDEPSLSNEQTPEPGIDTILMKYFVDQEEITRHLNDISDMLEETDAILREVAEIRDAVSAVEVVPAGTVKNDLSAYRQRMQEWKREGYKTDRLAPILDVGVEELAKRMFDAFERDVALLREIETTLDGLDTTGFKKKESDIRENLRNPDAVALTLKYLIELEIEMRRKMEMDL